VHLLAAPVAAIRIASRPARGTRLDALCNRRCRAQLGHTRKTIGALAPGAFGPALTRIPLALRGTLLAPLRPIAALVQPAPLQAEGLL
jgi:hypothetical protein